MSDVHSPFITLLTLGKTGSGKSLLGNRLLGLNEEHFFFRVAPDAGSQPRETIASNVKKMRIANGDILLRVLDTPGFFDRTDDISNKWLDVLKGFDLAQGQIDALVIVISLEDFTNCVRVMKNLMAYFFDITAYIVVVFTHFDRRTLDVNATITRFNEIIQTGTAGISFVFSDQKASPQERQARLHEIITHVKRIKCQVPLVKQSIKRFIIDSLKKNVEKMDIRKSAVTVENLRRKIEPEIDLVLKYVEIEMLENMCSAIRENAPWMECLIN